MGYLQLSGIHCNGKLSLFTNDRAISITLKVYVIKHKYIKVIIFQKPTWSKQQLHSVNIKKAYTAQLHLFFIHSWSYQGFTRVYTVIKCDYSMTGWWFSRLPPNLVQFVPFSLCNGGKHGVIPRFLFLLIPPTDNLDLLTYQESKYKLQAYVCLMGKRSEAVMKDNRSGKSNVAHWYIYKLAGLTTNRDAKRPHGHQRSKVICRNIMQTYL